MGAFLKGNYGIEFLCVGPEVLTEAQKEELRTQKKTIVSLKSNMDFPIVELYKDEDKVKFFQAHSPIKDVSLLQSQTRSDSISQYLLDQLVQAGWISK